MPGCPSRVARPSAPRARQAHGAARSDSTVVAAVVVGGGVLRGAPFDALLLLQRVSSVGVVAVAAMVIVAAGNGQATTTVTEMAALSLPAIDDFAHDTVPLPPAAGFVHVHPAGAPTEGNVVCAGMTCLTTTPLAAGS